MKWELVANVSTAMLLIAPDPSDGILLLLWVVSPATSNVPRRVTGHFQEYWRLGHVNSYVGWQGE